MSVLSMGLLIALIVLIVWMKWDDKRNWETVYEASGHRTNDAQERLRYLRNNGIRCRTKNYFPGTIRMMGLGGMQNSTQASVLLQVNKKQTDYAFKLLADFNK